MKKLFYTLLAALFIVSCNLDDDPDENINPCSAANSSEFCGIWATSDKTKHLIIQNDNKDVIVILLKEDQCRSFTKTILANQMTGDGISTLSLSNNILTENNDKNGQSVLQRVTHVSGTCSKLGDKFESELENSDPHDASEDTCSADDSSVFCGIWKESNSDYYEPDNPSFLVIDKENNTTFYYGKDGQCTTDIPRGQIDSNNQLDGDGLSTFSITNEGELFEENSKNGNYTYIKTDKISEDCTISDDSSL